MMSFLLWYLASSLLGLAVFPLAYRFMPALPDRGYAFSRALGLLLWGYLFWLLSSLHMVQNDLGGQVLALLVVLALSGLALRRDGLGQVRDWLASRLRLILTVEGVFLAAFALMALIRAASPDIVNTEKPMDMGFINSILRSPIFPPHDPWLSGYAISYYYFGHLLVAMMARITGTPGPVAFNLGLSLVFALAASGSYGVVYDLLAGLRPVSPGKKPSSGLIGLALLAPIFTLVLSNAGGFLQVMHQSGVFWDMQADGGPQSAFWKWLDIKDLTQPPYEPLKWEPANYGTGSWWWWRASRVVQDYTYNGTPVEIIDEFPAFSFLLADLHPHVLAMPFAFLGMALALNLLLGGAAGSLGKRDSLLFWELDGRYFLLSAVILGGLGFLNLWDFPIYVALLAGAYALRRARALGWSWDRLGDFVSLSIALVIAGALAYLPFYVGFSSQAGGILPSLIYFTRGTHLWVMFGTLFLPMGAFLIYLWLRWGSWAGLKNGLLAALLVFAALALVSVFLVVAIQNLDRLQGVNSQAGMAESAYLGALGAPRSEQNVYQWAPLIKETFTRRLSAPGGWITLFLVLFGSVGIAARGKGIKENGAAEKGEGELFSEGIEELGEGEEAMLAAWTPEVPASPVSASPVQGQEVQGQEVQGQEVPMPQVQIPEAHLFAVLMVTLACLLVLAPEFFYLRDQFGSRMNTVFKFYIQAWLMWSVVAAYGSAVLLIELRRVWSVLAFSVLLAVMGVGLVYPTFWAAEKLQGFKPANGFTLDGSAYIERYAPDERAAMQWLYNAPPGVIVEAVHPNGGQYSDFARVSVYSGQPTVLGWVGHESQWRGSLAEVGSRQPDIQTLYTTRSWSEAQAILDRYGIRYVVMGPRERETYQVNPAKEAMFQNNLVPVFQQGSVTVYEVP